MAGSLPVTWWLIKAAVHVLYAWLLLHFVGPHGGALGPPCVGDDGQSPRQGGGDPGNGPGLHASPPKADHLHVVVGVSTLPCTGEAKSLLEDACVCLRGACGSCAVRERHAPVTHAFPVAARKGMMHVRCTHARTMAMPLADDVAWLTSSRRLESCLDPATCRTHSCPQGHDHADADEKARCPRPKG